MNRIHSVEHLVQFRQLDSRHITILKFCKGSWRRTA